MLADGHPAILAVTTALLVYRALREISINRPARHYRVVTVRDRRAAVCAEFIIIRFQVRQNAPHLRTARKITSDGEAQVRRGERRPIRHPVRGGGNQSPVHVEGRVAGAILHHHLMPGVRRPLNRPRHLHRRRAVVRRVEGEIRPIRAYRHPPFVRGACVRAGHVNQPGRVSRSAPPRIRDCSNLD